MNPPDTGLEHPGPRVRDDSLWAITTYFNPVGYRTRRENYRVFRDRLPVPLIAVEYSVDGFDLGAQDAEILIQLHGNDVLWQKERLYNIARRHLPPHCQQVLWMDCDFVITGANWTERLKEALRSHAVVQPFHRLALLAKGVLPPPQGDHEIVDWRTSLVAYLRQNPEATSLFGKWGSSFERKHFHGGVWAARRDICDAFEFYDRLIVGGGDKAFTAGLYGTHADLAATFAFDEAFRRDYVAWAEALHALVGRSIGDLDTTAYHLWHGKLANRGYDDRQEKLRATGFKAMEDIALDAETHSWRWATDKPAVHDYVRSHFIRRREDG